MNYLELARAFDREELPTSAAWAYELAIQQEGVAVETLLDLAVLYFVMNDPGYFTAHQIDKRMVDEAYPRALAVLDIAEFRFGRLPEIMFWRLHMKERVLGEILPNEVYERLASQGVAPAIVALYVATRRSEHSMEASRVFDAQKSVKTARSRYLLSFA
ncbi:MAG: hypothetical protein JWM95_59 [Gemmatimonadetes bacterium]|nr:hypothetical protein [Gemmatimonadota bacterium]